MDEQKSKAIVIRAIDYNDNDKLLSLYTVSWGKITATLKGVKKATAKLKFAAEPFNFGEYIFANSNGRYTAINCDAIESFYSLREDIDKYYCGSVVLDVLGVAGVEDDPNTNLFVLALKTLNNLMMSVGDNKTILVKFLLEALATCGFKVVLNKCASCGNTNMSNLYFDSLAGGLTCVGCKTPTSVPIKSSTISSLRIIDNTDIDRLNIVKLNDNFLNSDLYILNEYFETNIGKLNTLRQLLNTI